jgi:hypothetical protein
MYRTLIAALTILHLGPGLAFVLLAFGCDGSGGGIPLVCGHNVVLSFAALTLAGWLVLSVAWVFLQARKKDF